MIVGEEEEFLQQNKLFKELEKGHQYALQLMNMLASPSDDEGIESQRILVDAVIRSFESAITNLRLHDGCEKMAGSQGCHVSSDCPDKENVEMIVRGCNKKRKITQPQIAATSTISNHTEDGYAWRKYGQKEILGSKFPRSYFRCTHKSDQGCPAIRQVQRLDHNPSLMQITYMGIHTCTPIRANTELATESCESPEFLLNFETKSMTSGSQLSSFPFLEKEDANEKLLRTESTPSCRWAGRFSSGDFGTTGSFDLLKELRYIGLNAGDVGPAECTFPGLDMGLASFSQLGELHHGGSASA